MLPGGRGGGEGGWCGGGGDFVIALHIAFYVQVLKVIVFNICFDILKQDKSLRWGINPEAWALALIGL